MPRHEVRVSIQTRSKRNGRQVPSRAPDRFFAASVILDDGTVDRGFRAFNFPAIFRGNANDVEVDCRRAAVVTVLSAPAARSQAFINVLTGGTSGVYYPLGVAIGKIYSDKIPDVKTQVQATQGVGRESDSAATGRGEIAFTLGDSLKSAWDGEEDGRLQDPSSINCAPSARFTRTISRSSRPPTAASRLWPTSRARASRSRAEIGHRTQRARHPQRRGTDLQGYRQGRISAVRRIRRPDEEPATRRDAAIGGPRRGFAEGSEYLDRYRRGVGSQGKWSTRSARHSCR